MQKIRQTIYLLLIFLIAVISGCTRQNVAQIEEKSINQPALQSNISLEDAINNLNKKNSKAQEYHQIVEYPAPQSANLLDDGEMMDISTWEKFSLPKLPIAIYYPPEFDSSYYYSDDYDDDELKPFYWGINISQDNMINITVYSTNSDKLNGYRVRSGQYKYKLKNGVEIYSSPSGACLAYLETENYYFLFQSGICGDENSPFVKIFHNILYNLDINDTPFKTDSN